MKTKDVLIVIGIVCFSCSRLVKTEQNSEGIKQDIINIEQAFSDYSKQHGFAKAIAEYAADDVIKLNSGRFAAFGKAQLRKEANVDSIGSSQGTLTWKPLKVDVSESGDMASAFGDWYFTFKLPETFKDTTLYGNYITVWKKQKDGTWKFIIDGGNPNQGPTSDIMLELVKK